MLNNFIDRIKLPFRKEKELYLSLYHIIGFYPRDISLYKLALMHKSMFRRNEKGRPVNNERLEFLGDAILDATAGDIVYRHFPGKREGFLTTTRSKLVQRDTLNRLADEMGLTRLILSNYRNQSHNSYMGGNAFEALVGAIYLDRGYDACMRFMQQRVLKEMINLDKVAYKEVNFKSKLIEWGQKNRVALEFVVLEQKKDDNGSPFFKYRVEIEGVKGCEGSGYSKKESQQQAAKLTLQRLRREPQFIDSVFAAKTDRTKMEEEPVLNVPDPEAEVKDSFIIHRADRDGAAAETAPARRDNSEARREQAPAKRREAQSKQKSSKNADSIEKSAAADEAVRHGDEHLTADKRQRRRSPMYAKGDTDKAPKTAAQTTKAETQAPNSAAQTSTGEAKESPKADCQTATPARKDNRRSARSARPKTESKAADDELSFDDIDTGREKSREEIIAAAEAAAFGEA